MTIVHEALWREGTCTTSGYILQHLGHAVLVQRLGIRERYWIHENRIMAVFA